MRHLLKSAASSHDDSEALNLAIEVVGASGQAHLSRQVSTYLKRHKKQVSLFKSMVY